jgi:hypothetical protein
MAHHSDKRRVIPMRRMTCLSIVVIKPEVIETTGFRGVS